MYGKCKIGAILIIAKERDRTFFSLLAFVQIKLVQLTWLHLYSVIEL